MSNKETIIVELCMGSACFARGNNHAVNSIKAFIEEHGMSERIAIKGALCEGLCAKGPVVKINGVLHYDLSAKHLVTHLQKLTEGF